MDTLGPDAIGDEKLRWLYNYWRAKARERKAAVEQAGGPDSGTLPDWLLPQRDQIDPLDLKPGVLPHILLAELVESPAAASGEAETKSAAPSGKAKATDQWQGKTRWRFRLVGTSVAKAAGFDPTWHFLDEALPGAYGDYVLGLYDALRRSRRPVYSESAYRGPNNRETVERGTLRLMLPLTGAAEAAEQADPVRFVLSGQVFVNHTTADKRGVLDEGPFDQGLRAFIDGD